ncbi:hypothetical protein [Rubripirellula reticaptiva]|uniref:hypothetical protein n=1 Tax=Rubripirellula reticaptiva TaxID=2528013 RepID=UPI001643FED4|nr:hypothetical protein [Rubripirellula reticaptiva]
MLARRSPPPADAYRYPTEIHHAYTTPSRATTPTIYELNAALNTPNEQTDSAQAWRQVLDALACDDLDVISAHYQDRDGKDIGLLWRHSPDANPVPCGTDAIAIRETMWVREDDWISEDIDAIMDRLNNINGLELTIEERRESRYLVVRVKGG